MDHIWPVISNKEVLAVSQSYAGFSGGPFKASAEEVTLAPHNPAMVVDALSVEELAAVEPLVAPEWQYFYKPLAWGGDKVAVLLMNHANHSVSLDLQFADVPGLACTSCKVRDIWNHKDLGTFTDTWGPVSLPSHENAFLVLSAA